MRKNFKWLTALAVAVAATGCSNDDLMTGLESRPDGAVGVNAYVPTITRGAALNSNEDLQKSGNDFDLFAYKTDGSEFMGIATDGIAFTWLDNAWNYENAQKDETKYWEQANGSNVTFYAVSPKADKMPTDAATLNIGATSQTIEYTVPATSSEQVDLMYARTDAMSSTTGNHLTSGITLDFQHALSQIVFKGKVDGTVVKAVIESVILENVVNGGTYTFPTEATNISSKKNGSWEIGTTTSDYSAAFTSDFTTASNTITSTTGVDISKSDDALLLIPQDVKDNIKLSVNATLTVGDDELEKATYTALLSTEKWEEGKKYTYTITFSTANMTAVMVATSNVASWEEVENEDVPVEEEKDDETLTLATVAASEAQVGYVLLSNGEFAAPNDYAEYAKSASGTPETTDGSSESGVLLRAVGMVFHTFDDDDGAYTVPESKKGDGTDNTFTNGLVVSWTDIPCADKSGNYGMKWQTTAVTVGAGAIANHNDIAGSLNLILGQQHTAALRTFNEAQTDDSKKVIPVLALDEWAKTNSAPSETTSGWYIPSAKELDLLANGDRQIEWAQANDENVISVLNTKLDEIGAEEFAIVHGDNTAANPYACYWSCSEISDNSGNAYGVYFASGNVGSSLKTHFYRVRAVCAF